MPFTELEAALFARLVGKNLDERRNYFRAMKDLYGERSRVVQGDPAPVVNVEKIERYMRRAIIVYTDRFNNGHDDMINRLGLGFNGISHDDMINRF